MCPGVVGGEGEVYRLILRFALCIGGDELCLGAERSDVLRSPCRELRLALFGDEGAKVALAEGEFSFGVDDHVLDIEIIVGPLGAVYERSALNSYQATIGLYILVSQYDTGLHLEADGDLIALLTFAGDVELSIGGDVNFSFVAICVGIPFRPNV